MLIWGQICRPQLYKMLAPAEAVKLSIREVRSKVQSLSDNLLTPTLQGFLLELSSTSYSMGYCHRWVMNAPSLVPECRKQAGRPATGAQLLAAGRGAAREAAKGTGIAMKPWTCQGAASGQGQGVWALITVVLGYREVQKKRPRL